MSNTVTFAAEASFGYEGRQFVARVDGRDAKYTFRRTFIGRREGKRKNITRATVDDCGLYEVRDIDRKGCASDCYQIVWRDESELRSWPVSMPQAMEFARALVEGADVNALARPIIIAGVRELYDDSHVGRDPTDSVTVRPSRARLLGIESSSTYGAVAEAAAATLARLTGGPCIDHPDCALDSQIGAECASSTARMLPGIPTETLVAELARRGVRVSR